MIWGAHPYFWKHLHHKKWLTISFSPPSHLWSLKICCRRNRASQDAAVAQAPKATPGTARQGSGGRSTPCFLWDGITLLLKPYPNTPWDWNIYLGLAFKLIVSEDEYSIHGAYGIWFQMRLDKVLIMAWFAQNLWRIRVSKYHWCSTSTNKSMETHTQVSDTCSTHNINTNTKKHKNMNNYWISQGWQRKFQSHQPNTAKVLHSTILKELVSSWVDRMFYFVWKGILGVDFSIIAILFFGVMGSMLGK